MNKGGVRQTGTYGHTTYPSWELSEHRDQITFVSDSPTTTCLQSQPSTTLAGKPSRTSPTLAQRCSIAWCQGYALKSETSGQPTSCPRAETPDSSHAPMAPVVLE